MADVWLQVNDGEYGPDSRAWHVEVDSEVHKRLLSEGAHEVPGPDGESVEDTEDMTVAELRERASELDVEGRSSMSKAELAAAVEAAEAD